MASRLASILVLVIVAATLIAGLIAGAQNESNGPVDLIVLNGRVYTAEGRGGPGEIAEALAVRGNQILKVGTNREIRRLTRRQTTVIDARGGTVVPGFVDSHVNLVESGLAAHRLDLRDATTFEDVERAISAYAASHANQAWIEGDGWDPSLSDKLPTRHALDALVSDRPAAIVSSDARVMWVNSKALDAARIGRRTPNPKGGIIVRDKRTGDPTGILKDAAQGLLAGARPPASAAERARALEDAIALAHQAGVTSVHNVVSASGDLQILARLRRSGEMALRVYQLLNGTPVLDAGALAAFEQVREEYPEVPLFKTGAVRIPLAGPGASTDAAARAQGARSLATTLTELDQEGWQAIVSIEDGDPDAVEAMDTAVRAFELVASIPDFRAHRHRIETGTMPPADVVARLAALGVTVSPRPAAPLDPLASIAAEVESADSPVYARLLRAALDSFTRLAAYASFDDQRKGTLEAGMLADLVILSDDVFATPAAELKNVKVNVTVFDGKVVYDRAAANATTH